MAAAPLHVVPVQTTGAKGGLEYSIVDVLHSPAERGARSVARVALARS
jgi:hypothetical protein